MNLNRLISCRNSGCFSLTMTTACLFKENSPQTLVEMDDGVTENIIDNDVDEFMATHCLQTVKTYTSVCFKFRKQISTIFGIHRRLLLIIFPMEAFPFSLCWSQKTFFAHEVFREAYKSYTNDFPVSCFDKNGNIMYQRSDSGNISDSCYFLHETMEDAYAEAVIKMYKSRKFKPLV